MPPLRIASLLAGSTEILYGLGLGNSVVAISHECDWPAEVAGKPRVTRTHVHAERASGEIDQQVRNLLSHGEPLYAIDTARLAELAPDLIVTQAQCDVCAVRYADVVEAVGCHPALRQARIVAVNPTNLADIFSDIVEIGKAAGVLATAENYVQTLQQRVDAVRAQTAGLALSQRPRVACIEWIDPPMAAGNWMPELIEIAGGINGLTVPGKLSRAVSPDELRTYDPQVTVVMPCGFDLNRTLAELGPAASWPAWARRGRVVAVDGNAYFNRSGPRMVDSLEFLAHLIHPELFGPPDPLSGVPYAVLNAAMT